MKQTKNIKNLISFIVYSYNHDNLDISLLNNLLKTCSIEEINYCNSILLHDIYTSLSLSDRNYIILILNKLICYGYNYEQYAITHFSLDKTFDTDCYIYEKYKKLGYARFKIWLEMLI